MGILRRPGLLDDQIVRSSKTGRVCIVRVGEGRWLAGTERKFLAHLIALANVKAAARARSGLRGAHIAQGETPRL